MKLQHKYNRATVSLIIFVLFLAGIAYYFLIHRALLEQLDEALRVEEQEIHHHINNTGRLPAESEFRDQIIDFEKSDQPVTRKFISTSIYNESSRESEIVRRLIFPVSINNEQYIAIVTKSQNETEDLLWLILMITALMIALLLFSLFIANRILLKQLWKPFYSTLSIIKDFHLAKPANKKLPKNDIDEFTDLNEAWEQVTKKITSDFESLKVFAENASHEMQTPLAIINSKLDLIIQGHDLKGDIGHHVQSIYDSVHKLTRLNQTLLLLTKIENDQYAEKEKVNMDELIRSRLETMEELIAVKELKVTLDLKKSVAYIHPHLADMLISNMLLNSIRHNVQGGKITLSAQENGFSIANTGIAIPLHEKTIFDRFHKDPQSTGTGLGLALVKQICDSHHYSIQYFFQQGLHVFKVAYPINGSI